jgi:hypothetical protein
VITQGFPNAASEPHERRPVHEQLFAQRLEHALEHRIVGDLVHQPMYVQMCSEEDMVVPLCGSLTESDHELVQALIRIALKSQHREAHGESFQLRHDCVQFDDLLG